MSQLSLVCTGLKIIRHPYLFQEKNLQNFIFHLIDLKKFGLCIKEQFPNDTYDKMSTYNRKIRVDAQRHGSRGIGEAKILGR